MGMYGGGGGGGGGAVGYGVYGSGAAGLGLALGDGYGVATGQGGLSLQTGLGASRGYAVGYGGGLGLGLAAGGGGGALMPYGSPAFAAGRSMLSGGLAGGHPPQSLAAMPPLATRNVHKATLQGLNQRFTGYVEKVRLLQRENAALEAQLQVLAGGAPISADGDLAVDYEERVAELRTSLETLATETASLEVEADNVRATAEELRAKYDFETGIHYQLQSDITLMKKDIEFATDSKVTLATKITSLTEELAFLKMNYEEEMATYHVRLGTTESTSAVIEVDTVRSVDVTTALSKIRDEYEEVARKHRAEAEAHYTSTMERIQESTAQTTAAITELKTELSTVQKDVQSHYSELQTTLSESYSLEQTVAMHSARSSTSVASYQTTFASLEVAIATAKSDLQRQLVAYQALVDVKLVLDAEIATYKRLLEGEEDMWATHARTHARVTPRVTPRLNLCDPA
ncbi:thread biopolymer filament subunit gamma-like [Lethenteron reissneri]|uniref:thread biopolymer filament subunit gamma-like n=1 Tax=Lethenteron reissneri TaxID=7753 RepID=UPI002AB5DFE9|nr:thread biopolymer filament subunit gamma-like [Lethenteron reissneri]